MSEMARESRNRISRRDAEKVLDGDQTSAPAVAALLAAARRATPMEPGVLGEVEALASFRVAHAAAAAPAAKHRGRIAAARAAAVAALSTKLAAGAVAALAASGVVLAASTGVLPGTGTHDHAKQNEASASPTPDLRGLCTAYRAELSQAPGKALTNPAYSALSSAARPATVATYCATLLGDSSSHGPSSHPTGGPGVPSRPTEVPPTHPTARPTAGPSGTHPRPTTRPTVPVTPHPRLTPTHH
jgi:hypothetical protein